MRKCKLPKNSFIAKYTPYDYADSYAKIIFYQEPIITADFFFNMAFKESNYCFSKLIQLRNYLVKPLKLDVVGSVYDMLCEQTPSEVIFGKSDKHLTFYTSMLCSRCSEGGQELRITTIVKYHNILGKMYFCIIRPFHYIMVKYLLRKVEKNYIFSLKQNKGK